MTAHDYLARNRLDMHKQYLDMLRKRVVELEATVEDLTSRIERLEGKDA